MHSQDWTKFCSIATVFVTVYPNLMLQASGVAVGVIPGDWILDISATNEHGVATTDSERLPPIRCLPRNRPQNCEIAPTLFWQPYSIFAMTSATLYRPSPVSPQF